MVLEGARLLALGLAIGLVAAALASRAVQGLLFSVRGFIPTSRSRRWCWGWPRSSPAICRASRGPRLAGDRAPPLAMVRAVVAVWTLAAASTLMFAWAEQAPPPDPRVGRGPGYPAVKAGRVRPALRGLPRAEPGGGSRGQPDRPDVDVRGRRRAHPRDHSRRTQRDGDGRVQGRAHGSADLGAGPPHPPAGSGRPGASSDHRRSRRPGDPIGEQAFKIEVVARDLETPWGIAFLPDGRTLLSERPGRLRIVEKGRLLTEPVAGTPKTWAVQDGGLLDVEVHPRHADQRLDLPVLRRAGSRRHVHDRDRARPAPRPPLGG